MGLPKHSVKFSKVGIISFHISVFSKRHSIWHLASIQDILLSKRKGGRERRPLEKREGGRKKTENLRIPMFFGNPIKTGKHDGKDDIRVFFYQTHDVFIIPIIECPFCHL